MTNDDPALYDIVPENGQLDPELLMSLLREIAIALHDRHIIMFVFTQGDDEAKHTHAQLVSTIESPSVLKEVIVDFMDKLEEGGTIIKQRNH